MRLISLGTLALATVSLSPVRANAPATSGDLATLYDALRAPTVAGSLPAPPKLTVGHAEIRPGAGSRLLLLSAAGELCGYVLDGPATLVYRIEDRFSIPIARRNLRRAHRVDVNESEGALTITAPLDGAAVWGWNLDLGGEIDGGDTALSPPKWLREILDEKLTDNPERDMLLARHNGEPEYRWAVFKAAGDDLQLDFDPRPAVRSESLIRFDKVGPGSGPFSGRLADEQLVTQPLGRSWLEGNPLELLAVDTEIELRAEGKHHLEVTTRSRLQFLREGLQLASLSLWHETYDEKLRPHEYRISRLTLDGKPAPYLHRENSLFVELPQPSGRDRSVVLEVTAAGDVLERPAGDSYWRLVAGWYPRPAHGGDEMAEIRLSVDVPGPWVPFAPGEVLERTSADGRSRGRTRLPGPMNVAMVLAGRYSTVTEEQEGARVHISTYASVKKQEAERLARIVLAIRACLERWLGVPYPFQDLQVIEVNDWGWGQAPPGMIFITQEAFLSPARAKLEESEQELASFMTRGINERVAHEVAHGWFPHVAKISRVEENWLSESFADYASAYCLVESMDKRQSRYYWKRQLDHWKYWSKQAGDTTSVFLASHLTFDEKDRRNWHFLLYGRGPLILQAVRERLEKKHGEEKGKILFLTWIRSYVKNFTYKYAETRHLIGILDQITGEQWTPFFERYLLGTESPEVE